MTTVLTQQAPTAPKTIDLPTLQFEFDQASTALVVDSAGRSAGASGSDSARFIPGTLVESKDGHLVVSVTTTDTGGSSTIGKPPTPPTPASERRSLRPPT